LRRGATESWLHVIEDATVEFHVENSGARFLRRGAEARDEILTPAEAAWRWPEHAQAIRRALNELGCTMSLKTGRPTEITVGDM